MAALWSAFVSRFAPTLIIAGTVALASFLGGWAAHKRIADGDIAKIQATHAYREAAYQRRAAEDAAQALAETQEWANAVEAAEGQLDAARMEITTLRNNLDRLQLDSGGLRNRLATYAAASRAGGDTLAACQARAASLATYGADLGEAAAEIGGLARVAASERDQFAAEVAALIAAWPSTGD